MEKKNRLLAVIGLVIVGIGAVGTCLLRWPAGLLCILPSAIPHISHLWPRKKRKKKNEENG